MDFTQLDLTKYKYGKVNTLSKILTTQPILEYNPMYQTIMIPGVYSHHGSFEGECSELVIKLLKELRDEYPQEHFYFASGTEPQFFFGDSNHCFAMHSQEPLIGPSSRISLNCGIETRFGSREGITIIDPTYNLVLDYADSAYLAKNLFSHSPEEFGELFLDELSDLILGDTINNHDLDQWLYNGRILSFNDDGDLLYLSVDFSSSKPRFYLHGQRQGENPQVYDEPSINSTEVLELLERLNATSFVETDKRLLY